MFQSQLPMTSSQNFGKAKLQDHQTLAQMTQSDTSIPSKAELQPIPRIVPRKEPLRILHTFGT
jgi:hypothetical protein